MGTFACKQRQSTIYRFIVFGAYTMGFTYLSSNQCSSKLWTKNAIRQTHDAGNLNEIIWQNYGRQYLYTSKRSQSVLKMDIELASLSPMSFEAVKEGDIALIKCVKAKTNEYREKIGPAKDCFLVFKGPTKVGMIPLKVATDDLQLTASRKCLISKVDKSANRICISITKPSTLNGIVS